MQQAKIKEGGSKIVSNKCQALASKIAEQL